jgi:hypothetical protein
MDWPDIPIVCHAIILSDQLFGMRTAKNGNRARV